MNSSSPALSAASAPAHRHGETSQDERHFDGASWAVLGLAALVLAACLAVTSYRFSLPTDGWIFQDEGSSRQRSQSSFVFLRNFVFGTNILGRPSPIQPGDALLAIEGQPIMEIAARARGVQPQRPATWEVGQSVRYTVRRGEQVLDLDVPLYVWTLDDAVQNIVKTGRGGPQVLGTLLMLAVFLLRPRSTAARLLLLFSACQFSSVFISKAITGARAVALPEMFYPAAYWPADFFNTHIFWFLIAPLAMHLVLVFPVVKGVVRDHPWLTLGTLYGLIPGVILAAFVLESTDLDRFGRLGQTVFQGSLVPAGLVAVAAVGHTLFTVREPVARGQIRWVAYGLALTLLGYGGYVALTPTMFAQQSVPPTIRVYLLVWGTLLPVCLALAILRHRLFDIDLVINRTLVYGVLTATLALSYWGGVVLLQQLLRPFTAGSDLAIIGSTLVVAALFQPVRTRIQTAVDRRFYRAKYDANRTLEAFSATLRDEVDLNQLSERLLEATRETLRPSRASLWLRKGRA